jgi:hypothetical protein
MQYIVSFLFIVFNIIKYIENKFYYSLYYIKKCMINPFEIHIIYKQYL